jgi:hypothetical protein
VPVVLCLWSMFLVILARNSYFIRKLYKCISDVSALWWYVPVIAVKIIFLLSSLSTVWRPLIVFYRSLLGLRDLRWTCMLFEVALTYRCTYVGGRWRLFMSHVNRTIETAAVHSIAADALGMNLNVSDSRMCGIMMWRVRCRSVLWTGRPSKNRRVWPSRIQATRDFPFFIIMLCYSVHQCVVTFCFLENVFAMHIFSLGSSRVGAACSCQTKAWMYC